MSNISVKAAAKKRFRLFAYFLLMVSVAGLTGNTFAQVKNQAKSQEVSEVDGVPVLLKHLPDWDRVRTESTFAVNRETLKAALGQRPILEFIDFAAGTEAASAPYPAGRLLIVEYSSPQASIEADNNFINFLSQNNDGRTFYKRVGNYSVFVFDASDEMSANALIEEVKYEKNVQWLGEDPFLFQRLERDFVVKTSDLFLSTVGIIVIGMTLSVIGGLIVGYIYFQVREKQRHTFKEFSDAGGMTRLNLDGLTPDISPNKLLNE